MRIISRGKMKHFKEIQTKENANGTKEVIMQAAWGMVEIGPIVSKAAAQIVAEVERRDK